MGEKKKFSSKDMLAQLRQTPDLAYEFSREEIFAGIEDFFRYAGYTVKETTAQTKQDLVVCAQRTGEKGTHRVTCVMKANMREVAEGSTQLKQLKSMTPQEDGANDFAVVVPPVSERHLIDYMDADDHKLANDLRDNGIMLWICNPKERSVACLHGAPRDNRILEYLKFPPGRDFALRFANMPFRSRKTARQAEKDIMGEE